MGVLVCLGSHQRVTLGERSLVGRSPVCQIRLDASAVSAEHAAVFWSGDRWWVRDLGSTNGTFVGDERLSSGEKRTLDAGGRVVFGDGAGIAWELVDPSPPGVRARQVGGEAVREGSGSLLCLPDDDEPTVSVFVDGSGRWMADFAGAVEAVADQQTVEAGGASWRLELPPASSFATLETTHRASGPVHLLEACTLSFRVSSDEEYVEITVQSSGAEIVLSPRSHHYTLLTLARHRAADASAGLPERERGWVYADVLADELKTTRQKLNLDVCRARQQLAAAGIEGAGRIVERRPTTQQLRLGLEGVVTAAR